MVRCVVEVGDRMLASRKRPAQELFGLELRVRFVAGRGDGAESAPARRSLGSRLAGPSALSSSDRPSSPSHRVGEPLARAIPVSESEPVALAWLVSLVDRGIAADLACRDWTRLFRMPHVRRDGRPYRSPVLRLDGMTPIEPPAPILLEEPKKTKARKRREPDAGPPAAAVEAPLAKAFVAAGWLGRSLSNGRVTAYCPWETGHSTGTTHDSSTVIFGATSRHKLGWWHCSHASCQGRTQGDVIAALPPHARKLLELAEPPKRPLDETTAALTDAIRNAPDGVSLIAAQCGLGKTRAARTVAMERAAKTHKSGDSKRAPLHSKTAISLPTNKLVDEQMVAFAEAGVPAKRVRGVLSVLGPDGKPVCRFADTARHLADGGQSIPWEFCEGRGKSRCEYADECEAYGGVFGPKDARIILGPHELMGQLSGAAGKTGLLVVDEPPPLVETHVLSRSELDAAVTQLRHFDDRYSNALRPALLAIASWLADGGDDEAAHLSRALEDHRVDQGALYDAFVATNQTDALSCVKAAFEPDHDGPTTPPLKDGVVYACRWQPDLAQLVGLASKALGLVYRALSQDDVVARVEARGGGDGEKVIVIIAPNEGFQSALEREGSTVITDAGAELLVPSLTKILGYEPPLHVFTAPDGAPIERVMLRTRATRTNWMPRGQLKIEGSLVEAVARMVEWTKRDPMTRKVGIVTMRTVRLALEAACGVDVSERWRKAGQSKDTLDEARALLGPILAELPERPDFGHYGAIRGLDHWKGHDAVVTLGDPWLQLSDVQHECDYLGIDTWEQRFTELCRADLEQAQGRLRTVHRTKPGRALHIGNVMPGRWPMDIVFEELAEGRPQNRGRLPRDIADLVKACGGVTGLARELKITRMALHRYIAGNRGVPPDVLRAMDAIREQFAGSGVVPSVTESPLVDSLNRAFGYTSEAGSGREAKGVSVTHSPEPVKPVRQPGLTTPSSLPSPAELETLVRRHGGLRGLARVLSVPYPSLRRYLAGERQAPPDIVSALWRMLTSPARQGTSEPARRPSNRHPLQPAQEAV